MKGLLPLLSGFPRLRERAWPEIRAPRRAFSLGGLVGSGGTCGCCGAAPGCNALCGCHDVPDTIRLADSALGITVDLPLTHGFWTAVYSYAYPGLGGCPAKTVPLTYSIQAAFGNCVVDVFWPILGTNCPDPTGAPNAGYTATLTMTGCAPPAGSATRSAVGVGTDWQKLYGVGVGTTWTISVPGAWQCCVLIAARDCGGGALVGATVTIWTDSSKATQVATGTTAATAHGVAGAVVLNIGSAGTYYYEVAVAGNVIASATHAFSCGEGLTATAGCNQVFHVQGCNSASLQGATVTIWTDGTKATQLATGTTASTGNVTLYWNAACATSVYVEVACSRFVTYTNTGSYTCGNTTTVSLSAASGYHCAGCSGIPLADTLHLTDSVYGSTTLSYSAGSWVSATTSWSFPGDSCCSAASFGMVYTLTGSTCALSATYGHGAPVAGVPECPTGTARQTDVGAGSTTVTKPTFCGDSTAWNFSASVPATACPASASIYIYPSGATYTMTE